MSLSWWALVALTALCAAGGIVGGYPDHAARLGVSIIHPRTARAFQSWGAWTTIFAILWSFAVGPAWWSCAIVFGGGVLTSAALVRVVSRNPASLHHLAGVGCLGLVIGYASVGVMSVVLLFRATPAKSWSQEDKQNAGHFVRSMRAFGEAVEFMDRHFDPRNPLRRADRSESLKLHGLLTEALAEARVVRDEVLAKAHPDLPRVVKERYIPFLELFIRMIETPRTDPGVEAMRARGVALMGQWQDWWTANVKQVRFPNDVPE